MCFQTSCVAFCPQLFQIVPQAQKEKLGGDVSPAAGKETFEFPVIFQNTKSAFHLNGAVDAKRNSPFGFDVPLGTAAEPEQVCLDSQFLRAVVFRFAAGLAARVFGRLSSLRVE